MSRGRAGALLTGCLACAVATWAQADLPLAERKGSILKALGDLGNSVCLETLEQSKRTSAKQSFDLIERFRVEVGYVGGTEVYGWPKGERLAEEDVTRLIGGTVAGGDFVTMAYSVFHSPSAIFAEGREELRDRRSAWRYDFRVPVEGGDWRLNANGREASVGYHGSVWMDRDLLDVELDATADGLPRALDVRAVERSAEYRRARAADPLMPRRGALLVTEPKGPQSKTEVRYEDCHRYTAEAEVHFEEYALHETSERSKAAARLPQEFEAEVAIVERIDSDTAAVGDVVTARLLQEIVRNGETVIPKGTALHGRITRLPLIDGHRYIDFRFLYFDVNGTQVDIRDRSNEVAFQDERRFRGLTRVSTPIPGDGKVVRLPAGYRLFVKSAAAR